MCNSALENPIFGGLRHVELGTTMEQAPVFSLLSDLKLEYSKVAVSLDTFSTSNIFKNWGPKWPKMAQVPSKETYGNRKNVKSAGGHTAQLAPVEASKRHALSTELSS